MRRSLRCPALLSIWAMALALAASGGARAAGRMRLPALGGGTAPDIAFGGSPEQYAADIRKHFARKYPKLDPSTPNFEVLLERLTSRVWKTQDGRLSVNG